MSMKWGGEDANEVQWTTLYTDAPEEYDGFGTKTVAVIGETKYGKTLRCVKVREEHLDWQTNRYWSGMYSALTPGDYDQTKNIIMAEAS